MATIDGKKVEQLKKLYYEKKLSAPDIAKELNVSLDSVYYCMRKYGLSRRSHSENNQIIFERKMPSFSPIKISTKLNKELELAGTLLYWAEGYTSTTAFGVDFANSDPDMVFLFLRFLREVCGIKEAKLRAYLYCYSNQKVEGLIDFWSKLTRIPQGQFTKPYVRSDFRKEKIKGMPYGLIHIRYSDKKLLEHIRSLINNMRRSYSGNYTAL